VISKEVLNSLRRRSIEWQYSPHSKYEFYSCVDGVTVGLRLNNFPDESVCTLIVNDDEADLEEFPSSWALPKHRGEE